MAFEWYIFFSHCCLWLSLVWMSRWRVGAQNSCTSKMLSTPNDSLSLWRNPLVRGFSLTTTVPSTYFGMCLPGWKCLQWSVHRKYIMSKWPCGEEAEEKSTSDSPKSNPTMPERRLKTVHHLSAKIWSWILLKADEKCKKQPSRCLKRKWRSVKAETHLLIQKQT